MKKTPINKRLFLIHISFFIVTLISASLIGIFEIKERTSELILRVAERNRTLSQQIGFYGEQAVDGKELAKEKLKSIIQLHTISFNVLKYGGTAPAIIPRLQLPRTSRAILPILAKSEEFWTNYEKNVNIIINEPTFLEKKDNPILLEALAFVENNEPEMLLRDTAIVEAYSQENNNNQKNSKLVFLILFVVNILVIGLGAWLSSFFTKRSEESRLRNKAIIESVGDGLVVIDKNKKILEMNDVAGQLLAINPKDYIGKPYDQAWLEQNEKGEVLSTNDRPLQIALTTGKKFSNTLLTSTVYYVRKDKKSFPVLLTISPIIVGGKIIGVVDTFRDITKEKEVENTKNEFISLASHQLKTPPTAIKLLADRLLGDKIGELNKEQKEYVSNIRSANQRMLNLINALLNVSRIELGGFNLQIQEENPTLLLDNVIHELTPLIEKKKIKVVTSYKKTGILLPLDETLFNTIINNIITNAIRYTKEKGKIRIECRKSKQGETLGGKVLKKEYIVITVADNGYGIPDDEKNKIFDKFFRARNAKEKETDGTGLGLYIVKAILNNSGGLLWFTSEENKGSTFFIAIPTTGMKSKTILKKPKVS